MVPDDDLGHGLWFGCGKADVDGEVGVGGTPRGHRAVGQAVVQAVDVVNGVGALGGGTGDAKVQDLDKIEPFAIDIKVLGEADAGAADQHRVGLGVGGGVDDVTADGEDDG